MKRRVRWFSEFSPHPALQLCLVIAVALSAAMAVKSDYNRHPDEVNHFEAVRYYASSNFLPPKIGEPAVVDSYSPYGVSYLNYHWAEYFFAGKFLLIVSQVLDDQVKAARFFNVFLFAVLGVLFIYRSQSAREQFIIPLFLLITPQIWYLFSYVNNDAFALFISMLAVYQVAYPKSLLNKFFESSSVVDSSAGGIWFGCLAGLLLISKPNFWTFLVFIALWMLTEAPLTPKTLKKVVFISLIAAAVLAFRVGLDLYVNGETNFVGISYVNKFFGNIEAGKLLAYQEKIADYAYRPSTLENDLMNSHRGLKLREKGVSFIQLFTDWNWHRSSFNSFVGLYGYMNLWASDMYYRAMLLLYLSFAAYVIFSVVRSRDRKCILQLSIVLFAILLTVSVSLMLSWLYAFQAQGRYLFPVIGMIGLFVYSNKRYFNNLIVHLFLLAAFLLSVYSFLFVALAGINST